MAAHQVRALLMGGQACVLYGAAEFSRDTDIAILADQVNWKCLGEALHELQAERIYVPPADLSFLLQGHALHFRCHHPDAEEMRVDVMAMMRGVDDFTKLWERRVTLQDGEGTSYEVLSLPDLVKAKKTQRSKDWPMIRRLLESDYFNNKASPDELRLRFWLLELRTPELLIELAKAYSELASELIPNRPLLASARSAETGALNAGLEEEEKLEREKDRIYWRPLKAELERMRHERAGD